MVCVGEPRTDRRYVILATITFLVSLAIYVQTLAPSVSTIFDDSLELQLVCYQLGIAHPTGYPLYTLLGKFMTLLPIGNAAYRVNLLSALCGALTATGISLILTKTTGRHLAGLAAGVALAVSPVFWSQSTIAEVYTLNSLFVVLVLLSATMWQDGETTSRSVPTQNRTGLWLVALVFGLSLTHHRSMVLLLPALLVFIFLVSPHFWRKKNVLFKALLLVILPQCLYLYIPLRGIHISSLDGSYQNTLSGFLRHVTGAGYNVFLVGNPLEQSRALTDYLALFREQFGIVALALAALGFVYMCMLREWRKLWVLTAIAFATYTAFALTYKVADVEVFFIPSFLFVALWLGFGLALLMDLLVRLLDWVFVRPANAVEEDVVVAPGSQPREVWRPSPQLAGNILAQLVPLAFLGLVVWPSVQANYPYQDRSRDWDVHYYALDILSQPLEKRSAIVGILGEMTLLRYVQAVEGLRPDVETIAADRETERRKVVREKIEEGKAVYLTRPLNGITGEYDLSAIGPLIHVQKRPGIIDVVPEFPADIYLTKAFHLLGYNLSTLEREWQTIIRVTLFWEVTAPIDASYKISARIYNTTGQLIGQTDAFPVHDAYPTTAWELGEVVRDVYDIRIIPGSPPGQGKLLLILYRPENGQEVARTELGTIESRGSLNEPPLDKLGVNHVLRTPILDRVELLGYNLPEGSVVFEQGDRVPLNLLWKLNDGIGKYGVFRLWLGGVEAWQVLPIPILPPEAEPRPIGAFLLRQWVEFPLTARVPDGTHPLYLAGYATEAEAQTGAKPGLLLGKITVKGRERVFEMPSMDTQVGAVLDRRIVLLGFDLDKRAYEPGEEIRLNLYWRTRAEMDVSYTVFVHLIDRDGRIWAQQDNIPHGGQWPTTGWMQNEIIPDEHILIVPADAPPGNYRLITGMYQLETGKRLTAAAGNDTPLGDFIPLTEITVE